MGLFKSKQAKASNKDNNNNNNCPYYNANQHIIATECDYDNDDNNSNNCRNNNNNCYNDDQDDQPCPYAAATAPPMPISAQFIQIPSATVTISQQQQQQPPQPQPVPTTYHLVPIDSQPQQAQYALASSSQTNLYGCSFGGGGGGGGEFTCYSEAPPPPPCVSEFQIGPAQLPPQPLPLSPIFVQQQQHQPGSQAQGGGSMTISIPACEMHTLRKYFNSYSGCDRKLNYQEFVRLCDELKPGVVGGGGGCISRGDMERSFASVDRDNDGLLVLDEFLVAYMQLANSSQQTHHHTTSIQQQQPQPFVEYRNTSHQYFSQPTDSEYARPQQQQQQQQRRTFSQLQQHQQHQQRQQRRLYSALGGGGVRSGLLRGARTATESGWLSVPPEVMPLFAKKSTTTTTTTLAGAGGGCLSSGIIGSSNKQRYLAPSRTITTRKSVRRTPGSSRRRATPFS